MHEPEIAIAASPRDWAHRLHRHVADHGGARVRVTALQRQDVLDEAVDVLVADDTTSFLTASLVADLHRRGGLLLGVYDPDAPAGKGELLSLGADEVLDRGASADEFLRAIGVLARSRPARTVPRPPPGSLTRPAEAPSRRAHRAAVCAASGGAGATELAIALSGAVARRGGRPVLVDADEVAPAVAQRLGLPQYPNLRAAVDAAEQGAGGVVDTLTAAVGSRVAVLVGLSHGRDWTHVRPGELLDVLDVLAGLATHLVVNAGPWLEDTRTEGGQRRFGLTRAVVGAADTVVGVGLPTPVGLARLLDWVATVRTLTPTAPVHLVLNRAPASTFQRAEVTEELARSVTVTSITFLPPDPRVGEAAWAGRPVGAGPYTRAVAGLADDLLPVPARAPGPDRRIAPRRWAARA